MKRESIMSTLQMSVLRPLFCLCGLLLLIQAPAALADVFSSGGQSAGATEEQVYGGMLNTCRNELSLLKPLDAARYQRQEKEFNGDLAAATQYLLMRPRLDAGMRSTMDRLYQANLSRICQQIHNELFSQLLNQSVVAVKAGE
ncbi:hypothetical protein DQY68_20675 [Salmonella enterica subsp. salamae]|nr:hypothetical protein [Salmonella enterica subsp. salamae]